MTRKQALEELIAKVEARGTPSRSEWRTAFHKKTTLDMLMIAADPADWRAIAAALALGRAIPTPNAVMSPEDMALILFGRDGARYWLLWKLKALHAQEADA